MAEELKPAPKEFDAMFSPQAAFSALDTLEAVQPTVTETPPAAPEKPVVVEPKKEAPPEAVPDKGGLDTTPAAPLPDAVAKVAAPSMDDVKLPAYAKPNTAASFDALKSAAKAQLAEVQSKLDAATRELEELRANASKVDPAIEKELQELRAHRDATAVEEDPVFQARFAAPLQSAEETIYSRLRREGAPEDVISDIRKLAGTLDEGLLGIDWKSIYAAYPKSEVTVMRALADIDDVQQQKADALKLAKENKAKWAETRREALNDVLQGDHQKHEAELRKMFEQYPVFNPADDVGKTMAAKAKEKALGALKHESRAGLAVGFGLATFYKGLYEASLGRLNATTENQPAELAAAKKKVAELTTELTAANTALSKFRGATPKISGLSKSPAVVRTAPAPVAEFKSPLSSRLDNFLKQRES